MIISKLFLACECVGFYSNKKNYANCSTLGNLLIDQFQYPILQVTLYISFTNLIFSFLFFEDLFNLKYRQTVVYLLPRSMWKIAVDHNCCPHFLPIMSLWHCLLLKTYTRLVLVVPPTASLRLKQPYLKGVRAKTINCIWQCNFKSFST